MASSGLPPGLAAPAFAGAYMLGQAIDGADPLKGIGAQTRYDLPIALFQRCAAKMASSAPAAQLRRTSTHWLRYTRVSHSPAAGINANVERLVAGPECLGTASTY